MNLKTLRILGFAVSYIIRTTPRRSRLHRLAETDRKESARIAHSMISQAFDHIFKLSGSDIETFGTENIPDVPCLYVGNHNSYFDILTAECSIPSGVGFVAKESIGKVPGLADWMRLINCLFLDRDDIKKGMKTINDGAQLLKDGFSMYMFPEGTRGDRKTLGEFKGGSLKMAQKANVPIVPVAITGTADIFENNPSFSVESSHVKIIFGKPFKISELPKEKRRDAPEIARSAISEMLCLLEEKE